jgi:hypothetical protein
VLGVQAHGLRRKLCAVASLRAITAQGIMERWHASRAAATDPDRTIARTMSATTSCRG